MFRIFVAASFALACMSLACADGTPNGDARDLWKDAQVFAAEADAAPEASHYVLKGDAAEQFAELIAQHTESGDDRSRSIQLRGHSIFLYAVRSDQSPHFSAYVDLQGVEGIGDKSQDSDERDDLLRTQGDRYMAVLAFMEANGERISKDQFEQYAGTAQGGPRIGLYWKP